MKRRRNNEDDIDFEKIVLPSKRQNEDDEFIKRVLKRQEPSYLKWPKIVCDEEFLKELPEFNFRIKVNERDKVKRREEIFDKIIKQIQDNDKYCISYDPASNSYRVGADKKVIVISDEETPVQPKKTVNVPNTALLERVNRINKVKKVFKNSRTKS